MRRERMPGGARAFTYAAGALLLLLLGAPLTVAAHPSPSLGSPFPLELGAEAPRAVAGGALPAASTAWEAFALGLSLVLLTRWALDRRRLPLALSVLLVVLACETTLHSAHHLDNPKKAEQCAVYSASLHLSGLEASPATPQLSRAVTILDGVGVPEGQLFTWALDGPTPRAPPVLPA